MLVHTCCEGRLVVPEQLVVQALVEQVVADIAWAHQYAVVYSEVRLSAKPLVEVGNAMVVAAAVVAVVAGAAAVPQLEVDEVVQIGLLAPLLVLLLLDSAVASLLDDAPSALAFASVFRDFDELLLARDHILGNGRLYIDDSGSVRIGNLRSEEPDIFDPYTQQYVSTNVSYPRNVV